MFFNNGSTFNKDNFAIIDDKENKVSYKQLEEDAQILSEYVVTRSIVFILCDYDIETISFYYKVMCLRAVPLMLDKHISHDFLQQLIEEYRPAYIWCENQRKSEFDAGVMLRIQEHVLLRTKYQVYAVNENLALLLSTSGSTGAQKLVRISWENIKSNTISATGYFNIQPSDRGILTTPLNYAYTLSVCHYHWFRGAAILGTKENVMSKKFVEFFIRENVQNLAGVPYTFEMLKKIRFFERLPKEIKPKMFLSAGAMLPEDMQERLSQILGGAFWNTYGQTECTGIILAIGYPEICEKRGSIGKPINGVDFEVTGEGDSGELVIKGKAVCMGYSLTWKDLQKGDENNGVWKTGDVVKTDSDGFIYIIGRIKRFIKILGKRVSLDEIESLLKTGYPAYEFACIGWDDTVIICFTGEEPDEERVIKNYLSDKTDINKNMIHCKQIEEIPRNNSGKIQYSILEELYRF